MLNSELLQKLINKTGLSQTDFAHKIGVNRATISQILSGRNKKASLDVIGKIRKAYPFITYEWLIDGTGDLAAMFSKATNTAPSLFGSPPVQKRANAPDDDITSEEIKKRTGTPATTEVISTKENDDNLSSAALNGKEIDRIIFFYKDGSFQIYYETKP